MESFNPKQYTALTSEQYADYMEMFAWWCKITTDNDVEWYVQCGTMLGTIRCGGLIRWDDDIDIAIEEEDYANMKGLRTKLEHGSWRTAGISRKEAKKQAWSPQYKMKFVVQYAKLEHLKHGDELGEASLWIDIFKVKNGIYPQKHYHNLGVPDNMRLPLRTMEFCGFKVKVPNKAEDLLDKQFEGWRDTAVIYNHRGKKKKIVKGEVMWADVGGYQHFGTYPISQVDCSKMC